MAPFQYQQFTSPYANTIAQLLLHQNDPQAQAAQTIAAANAHAGELSAQAWGGAIQGITNAATNVVGTIQREREIAPKLALEKVQLENAQHEQAAQRAQASLLSQQGDPLPPGAEGPQRPSMLDENGFLDPSKVGPAYAALGFGDKVPDILHTVDLQNEAMKNYDTSTKQIANSKTIMQGVSAHGTLMLMNSGMPIDQAIDQATGAPVQTGRISAADVAKFKTKILTLPPEQQQAVLLQMKQDAARLGPTKTDKEGDITYDMFGDVQSKGGEKEKPDYTINGVRFSGKTNQPYGPAVPPQKTAGITARDDAERFRLIGADNDLGKPVSPEDKAWAKNYIKEKLLSPEYTADQSMARLLDTFAHSDSQLAERDKLQEQRKGRSVLSDKINPEYYTRIGAAEMMERTIKEAQGGNMSAAALQNLETTMAMIRAQNLNRINTAEIHQNAGAGSLLTNIESWIGKKLVGQEVPGDIQQGMLRMAQLLREEAQTAYMHKFNDTKTLYFLGDDVQPIFKPKTYNPLTKKVE